MHTHVKNPHMYTVTYIHMHKIKREVTTLQSENGWKMLIYSLCYQVPWSLGKTSSIETLFYNITRIKLNNL